MMIEREFADKLDITKTYESIEVKALWGQQRQIILQCWFRDQVSPEAALYYKLELRMKVQPLETNSKLLEVETRLTKFSYLSKEPLPGREDAVLFRKLKNSQKMPTRDKYCNFYHWYVVMSQFAERELQSWIQDKQRHESDELIQECLAVIDNLKVSPSKGSDSAIDYIMNIFIKEPHISNSAAIRRKLKDIEAEFSGEELRISIKNSEERYNENSDSSSELRIQFMLSHAGCQRLKDIISGFPEVKNIEIKKKGKQTRI